MVKSVDSGTNLPGFMPASSLPSFVTLDKSLDRSMHITLFSLYLNYKKQAVWLHKGTEI